MAVFRTALTEDEQRVVNAERDAHPKAHVRRKMLVVWLLHCGLTRAKSAEIAAVTRELVTITNTTVVNTDTMCDLLRAVAVRGLVGPVTLVLDNARYQGNKVVEGLAEGFGIELLFLPSYSPNLNLIERLWRFVKRKAAYGGYRPTFAEFRAAIEDVLNEVPTTHVVKLASLMTLNLQEFDDVSFLAA